MTRWSVHFVWAAIFMLVVMFSWAEIAVQAEDPSALKGKFEIPTPTKIAVVDTAYIFKNWKKFKAELERMKLKVQTAEATVAKQRRELEKLAEQQNDRNLSPDERTEIGNKLARRQRTLDDQIDTEKKNLKREETAIYHEMSVGIENEIEKLCKADGIQFVFRTNLDPVDPNDRDDVLSRLSRPLVYVDGRNDITPLILKALNND